MKQTLSVEQSATLIAKGISADKASKGEKIYKPTTLQNGSTKRVFDGYAPIFTLADIISLLPKKIHKDNYYLDLSYGFGNWTASYIKWDDCDEGTYIRDTQGEKTADELIDALNELLLWTVDNNHIDLTK